MDWLTFTSKVIDSLAWPLAGIALGLIFRRRLFDLLPMLRKVKAGPLEAEFEIATKQVLAGAADLSSPREKPSSSQVTSKSSIDEVVNKLLTARSEPTATIIEGWTRLDGELHRLGHQTDIFVDPLKGQFEVYQAIMASDVLPAETKKLIRELRQLRNKVAHAEVVPSPDSAQDYLVAVERVFELIRNYRKSLPGYTPDVR